VISPLLHMKKQPIKGKEIIICHTENASSGNEPELKYVFLTHYSVFQKDTFKLIGWLNLNPTLDKFGGTAFTYEFKEGIAAPEKIDTLETFLNYVRQFYGWWSDKEIRHPTFGIFQEVNLCTSLEDPHLDLLLTLGFKISFVGESHLMLRDRYQDHTGLGCVDMRGKDDEEEEAGGCLLSRKHFLKIEKAILNKEPLQGADLEALKWYLKEDKEALEYYLFLAGDNFKLYLDYARVMTTLEGVYFLE